MPTGSARSEDFRLDNMRLAFPHLFEMQTMDDGSKKYNATFLWPKTVELIGRKKDGSTLNVMQEAGRLATEAWGDKAAEMIKNELIKNPRLDGDGKQGINKKTGERHAGYAGHWFIRASANEKYPPTLIDDVFGSDGKPVIITDRKRLYPGCFVHVVLNLYTYDNPKGGKGLSFGLQMVQFAKDGERLGGGGGPRPEEFFQGVKSDAPAAAKADGAGGLFA